MTPVEELIEIVEEPVDRTVSKVKTSPELID